MTAQLRPHESIALTVALGQLHRGAELSPNVAQVCIFALGRVAGKVDYDAEETTYRVYPPGEEPGEPPVPSSPVRVDPVCTCGHRREAHEHYRHGSDCALCACGKLSRGGEAKA